MQHHNVAGRALVLVMAVLSLATRSVDAYEIDAAKYAPYQGKKIVAHTIINTGVTHPYIILRELHQEIGQPFELAVLEADLTRLENLGIFSVVDVEVLEAPEGLTLEYHVTEMPWIVPYLSFRYNDENGFSVGPALTSFNLAGRDIALSGRVLFGGTTTFEAKFLWPWIAYDHLSLDLTANRLERRDEVLQFEEQSYEVTPWVGYYLGRHGRIAGTLSWFQMTSDQENITLSPTNTDNLYRIGARIGWDSRDSWRDPRSGWQNELEIMRAGGFLGGDGDYFQATFDIRRFQRISKKQTLYLGGLTTLSTGEVGVEFPSYLQYRMGGSNTIRGYEIKELGPELLGKNQMIYTAEYLFNIVPLRPYKLWRWSVSAGLQWAIFGDLGIAWSEDHDFNWNSFKSGYGAGIRLLIPGSEVLRFDFAFSEDGDFAFHFGTWFRWTAQRQRLR